MFSGAESESLGYEHFTEQKNREYIFKITEGLAEYLRDNQVDNIILVDKAARPFGSAVAEYWREHFPNEKRPSTYFLNSDAFDAFSSERSAYDKPEQAQQREKVITQLPKNLPQLFGKDDQKTVIFDVCIHSGITLQSIINVLHTCGMKNILVVSALKNDQDSLIESDVHLLPDPDCMDCHPFGDSSLVREGKDKNVFSKRSEAMNKNWEEAVNVRLETKNIIEKGSEASYVRPKNSG